MTSESWRVASDAGSRELDRELADSVDDAVLDLTDLTDAQPARRLSGDPQAFASLYIRHRDSFAGLARRFLSDSRDVDEVVQETFLKMFLAIDELATEAQALRFCRRVLTNLCIDRYRADVRRPLLVEFDAEALERVDTDSLADPVVRAEDAAIVRAALAQLPPAYRAALIAREIEEKPLPVIAAELGIAEPAMKHLLARARRALRKLLEGTSVAPATIGALGLVLVLLVAAGAAAVLSGRGGAPALGGGTAVGDLGDLTIAHPRAQAPSVRSTPVTPGRRTVRRVRTAAAPVAPALTVATPPVSAVTAPATPAPRATASTAPRVPATPTPVVRPPQPVAPPTAAAPTPLAQPAFEVEGGIAVLDAPTMTNLGSDTSAGGFAASGVFSVDTAIGHLTLQQTVSRDATGNLAYHFTSVISALGESSLLVPGSIALEPTTHSDGSVALTVFATVLGETSAAGVGAPEVGPALTALTVSLVLAPDHRTVTFEHVAFGTA